MNKHPFLLTYIRESTESRLEVLEWIDDFALTPELEGWVCGSWVVMSHDEAKQWEGSV